MSNKVEPCRHSMLRELSIIPRTANDDKVTNAKFPFTIVILTKLSSLAEPAIVGITISGVDREKSEDCDICISVLHLFLPWELSGVDPGHLIQTPLVTSVMRFRFWRSFRNTTAVIMSCSLMLHCLITKHKTRMSLTCTINIHLVSICLKVSTINYTIVHTNKQCLNG